MATTVAVVAIIVFGAAFIMVRVGLFQALAELWKSPRRNKPGQS